MATFKKGQSMKERRIVLSSAFDQKGEGMTGVNAAFSMANDQYSDLDEVFTAPMLRYDTYEAKDGSKQNSYTESYSRAQIDKVKEVANNEGDAPVFIANVFPSKDGKGLVVDTNSLKGTDVPFDKEQHQKNTLAARALKAETYAKREKEEAAEVEAEDEKTLEA